MLYRHGCGNSAQFRQDVTTFLWSNAVSLQVLQADVLRVMLEWPSLLPARHRKRIGLR
jgi:hypothetical protein